VDVGVAGVDVLGQLLGAHVAPVALQQGGEHGPAGGGHPAAVLAQEREDALEALVDRSWHERRVLAAPSSLAPAPPRRPAAPR
jgi:hypothetical protein